MDTLLCLVLVALTGHDAFRVREAASLCLSRHVALAGAALVAGERQGCEETRQRCKFIVDRWHAAHADELAEAYKPAWGWPWIDYGRYVSWDAHSAYLDLARAAGFTNSSPEWPAYREATRLLVRDRLAARLSVVDLVDTVNWLADRHRLWCGANGYPVPP
jgi:hypothetical protein